MKKSFDRLDFSGVSIVFKEKGWVARPVSAKGLNPKEITMAEILKHQGYSTACIGKWHLGDQPDFLPLNHGFDYFYGIPYSEDMVPAINPAWPALPLIQNDKVVEAPVDLKTITRRYIKEGIRFITENKDKPFFLYFPLHLPGSEKIPTVDNAFSGKSANGAYGDAIEEIDWSVGRIVDAVKELGIEQNTMIIFTSDNGTPKGHGGSNAPLSGWGYTTAEGGMRVPCIVQWSGTIPAGTSNDELTIMMDWLPTFAKLAGAQTPQDRIIDGKDIWPLLSGDKKAKTPHDVFYYYMKEQLKAVREEKWKLYLPHKESKIKLIDLSKDIKEEHDLSDQNPEVVQRILQHAEKIRKELGDNEFKGEKVRLAKYIEHPKPLLLE